MRRGLLLLLSISAIVSSGCRPEVREPSGPIVIIIADALRHDFASIPGYVKHPSGIARLASQGTTFRKCVTTVGTTRGSFPGFLMGRWTGALESSRIDASWLSRLRKAGYETTFIASSYAFGRGDSSLDIEPLFDRVFLEQVPGRIARPMPEALQIFDRVVGGRKSDRIVIILHLFYPHAPYWQSSYADSVTELDRQIANGLAILDRHGLTDAAHVILTSDHGETLQEHGSPAQHGWTVYGEETRIPLIWKQPGQTRAAESHELVRNYDIGPTLMSGAGAEDEAAGRPIGAIVGGEDEPRIAFHAALASRMYPVPQIALRTDRYLLVQSAEGYPRTELYDYESDPSELYNLAADPSSQDVLRELAPKLGELKKKWLGMQLENRSGLTDEQRRTLQSLGYLGTGPSAAQPGAVLTSEPVPGVRARFVESFSGAWSRSPGDTYDSLFPVRLVRSSGGLFVVSNTTRDVSRLRPADRRTRRTEPHGPAHEDVWFQRRNFQLASSDLGLLALHDGTKLKRHFSDPHSYVLDSDGHAFAKPIATLPASFDDLLDAGPMGIVLFRKNEIHLRSPDGALATLARYASDHHRAAYSESDGHLYFADGQWVFRVRPGAKAELVHDVGAAVLSLAIRGPHLWVGTNPFPPSAVNERPIVIFDVVQKRVAGRFGSRVIREGGGFWNSIDVGPFGIAFPSQIVFQGDRLYVLDSGLERILAFELR